MRSGLKVAIAIVVLIAIGLAIRTLPIAIWLENFTAYVRGLGPLGYVVYVLVYAICCVLLIPASALSIGAGAIFGFAAGSVVVVIGATLGAAAAFMLARTVFRRRVETMAESNVRLGAIDRAIAGEGTKLMLLMRISGFPPFTWINYVLGVTAVRFRPFVLTTFFGVIPGVLAFTWAGAAGAAALTGRGNRTLLLVSAAGAIVVSVYIARICLRAVRDMLGSHIPRRS